MKPHCKVLTCVLSTFLVYVSCESVYENVTMCFSISTLSEKKVQKLSLGLYRFKRYTFVPKGRFKRYTFVPKEPKMYILTPKMYI